MHLGERIRYIRKEILNITQKEFGEQIGLKANSVSDIEKGKNNPTEQTIKAICREFNINEDWLRYGNEPMRIDNIEFGSVCREIGVKDQRARQAIMDYYALSPEDKELFWSFIDRFTK